MCLIGNPRSAMAGRRSGSARLSALRLAAFALRLAAFALRLAACALLMLALLGHARPARAQSETVPPEIQALLTDIDDIDKLRVLNPLKLKPDQIDKLVPVIRAAQKDYLKTLADAAVPPLREISKDIRETRRKLLAGGAVPSDLDANLKKIQAEYVKRRKAQDNATLKSLADDIHKLVTQEQFDAAVKVARTLTTKDGKEPKGTDEQFFNLYVMGTFIAYPRIIPLLEDMKKALSGDTAGDAGEGGK